MRKFSIRPGITFKGRQFKGLRGWAGKPLHPPLTDVPVGAYVLVAAFDVISRIAGNDSTVGRDFFISGTHVIIAGAIVSLGAALTGFWDWWKSTSPGNQARRTANWHMTVMLTVTGIVIVDIIIRLAQWGDHEAASRTSFFRSGPGRGCCLFVSLSFAFTTSRSVAWYLGSHVVSVSVATG